jgi:iron complex outermembrane recepter protein
MLSAMPIRTALFVFVLTCASSVSEFTIAQTSKHVDVPPDELTAALWSQQSGVEADAAVHGEDAHKGKPPQETKDADPVRTTGLDEIVVTARKREENLQTVPVSVTALSGESLKQQSVTEVMDLQALVPSLMIQQHPDEPGALVFTLRGRKQNDVTLAADPALGIYLDGVAYPRTMGMQGEGTLLDVNQVEVLRGPQGTLYGRNTTSGAILIGTNDPTTDAFSGSVALRGGNYGALNVAGIVNLPITDELAARLVVQRGNHDGYGHDAIGTALESDDSQYYRAKLRWTSDMLTAILSGHYESSHLGGGILKVLSLVPAGNGLPAGGISTIETAGELGISIPQAAAVMQSEVANGSAHFYDNQATQRASSDNKRWDIALTLTAPLLWDTELKSISAAEGLSRNALGDLAGYPIVIPSLSTEDKYYSEEFQVSGSTRALKWIGGLYGGIERGEDDDNGLTFPFLTNGTHTIQTAGIVNTTLAVFAQTSWEFLPAWHLTTGARYSSDERRADVSAIDTNTSTCLVPAPGVESSVLAAQCPRTFRATFTKPTWLVSLDHQLTEQVLVYGKASTGYRSGGIQDRGTVEAETFTPFDPETNLEFESGIKSEFFDKRARLNLAAYHSHYSNLQVTTALLAADNSLQTAVRNAATAVIEGLETEASVLLTRQWELKASAAYTDARYIKFVDVTGDRSGEPFPVPRWFWNLSSRYTHGTPIGDLAFQLDYDWRSATVLEPLAPIRSQGTQGAYGLLNARADITIAPWGVDVALFGRNILSRKYVSSITLPSAAFGYYVGVAGTPAIFGVELTKTF